MGRFLMAGTVDPERPSPPVAEEAMGYVTVLYHGDLRRVGHHFGLPSGSPAEVIGRIAPLFERHDRAPVSLGDPAVSEHALQISYLGDEFCVEPLGRLPVVVYHPNGRVIDPQRVPAGSTVAIGQRVLLGLSVARRRENSDRLGLIGESEALWTLRDALRVATAFDGPVLLHGETGAGKELSARALLHLAGRGAQSLATLNCGSPTVEVDLFGSVKGAFTGAVDQPGLLEQAHAGWVFLDEIGEASDKLQSALLRVLDGHPACRLGSTKEIKNKVRFVAATWRDLSAGGFRADLYNRLRKITIEIPPLRARREDIPVLFAHFLLKTPAGAELGCWSPQAKDPLLPMSLVQHLMAATWPGNVRELDSVARALAKSWLVRKRLDLTVLPPVSHGLPTNPPKPRAIPEAPADTEPPHFRPTSAEELARALVAFGCNKAHLARALGVSRPSLYHWAKELGLELNPSRDVLAQSVDLIGAEATARTHFLTPAALKRRLNSQTEESGGD